MNTTARTRIQPHQVARHLRGLGWEGSSSDLRRIAMSLGMGRVLRSPALGFVVTQDEMDALVKELIR